ncbi:copper amine oxidase N-terminal domain-containing protein [Gordoniibacillus kamchatkensis]|uniref:copper amine oxidase N-terminal domain-containing protein n=1 Tax=Gordoniibacillus kamchatkensis TaxID=1590651 RepID=UPI0006968CFF|nr:copper amine oxidase N-terminal domain-containing protein [Paenibacillus sp. VKM B-2647]
MAIRLKQPFMKLCLLIGMAAAAPGCAMPGSAKGGQGASAASIKDSKGQAGPGLAELARTPTDAQVMQSGSIPSSTRALAAGDAAIPLKRLGNENGVPLRELARVLQFNTDWDGKSQTLRMGDRDFPYEFTAGSTRALKDGDAVTLPAAPVLADGELYLPVSAVADTLRAEMAYDIQGDRLFVSSVVRKCI